MTKHYWNNTFLVTLRSVREFYSNDFLETRNFIAVAIIIVLAMLLLSYLFSLSTIQNKSQLSEYECGFLPFDNATRSPFDIHFYIVGILFLIFDVEIALLFPWVVCITAIETIGFFVGLYFILILTIGFVYEWQIGALNWSKTQIIENDTFVIILLVLATNWNKKNPNDSFWMKLAKAAYRFFCNTWSFDQWIRTLIVMFLLYYILFALYNYTVVRVFKNSTYVPYTFNGKDIALLIIIDLLLNFIVGIIFMLPELQNTSFSLFLMKCPIAISPFILLGEISGLGIYLLIKKYWKKK